MNAYIIILSIGPVQSMIASARRSRDLWSGSWLLSELAKAGAKDLYQNKNVKLIFPHIENDEDLKGNSEFSVGNKLQAVIKAQKIDELNDIIQKAKQAIIQRFETEAKTALNKLNQNDIRTDIWDKQIKDFVEIQSAWAKIDNNDYLSAVQLASKVLAARKATRNFNPSAHCPYQENFMIPKSSLDGLRETVLHENVGKQNNLTRKKLSLSPSEQLDTVGVIKRLGFGEKAEQFTPISRVMANAWINNLIKEGVDFTPIKETCEILVNLGVITRVKGNQGIYQNFAYDAELLYQSRLEAKIAETNKSVNEENDKDLTSALSKLGNLKALLKPLWQKYGQPYTYGALLLADGDRMGELLDKAQNLQQHQAITKALSNFAGNVADIMRKHHGHCIYAGGDDVLGFVPLDKAYQCANELQKAFAKCLQIATNKLKTENQLTDNELKNPTLSVGLAICHLMTPLGIIRELAGQAEKYAKGDHIKKEDTQKAKDKGGINEPRNALGILLSVRGGTDIKVRFNWHDEISLDTFELFVKFYKDKAIPSRVAYDIRGIYLKTHQIAEDNHELNQKIQQAELTRMLNQARTNGGQTISKDIIATLKERGEKVGLDKLADELLVARWLAAKTQKELGKE